MQQLVLARIGVSEPELLGYPVARTSDPVLYLAMDRPRQAARSLRRMVTEDHREPLNRELAVWLGPLPFDPLADVDRLANFVQSYGAGTLIVDSVKDLGPGVSEDKVASALNQAWQEVIACGVELVLLHHERKGHQGGSKAHTLDDVYGSNWLTAGLGSVIAVVGEPGDPLVELRHLKQPASPVGPLQVQHVHAEGRTGLWRGEASVVAFLRSRPGGSTVKDIALGVYSRASDADVRRVSRELTKLEKSGLVERALGSYGQGGRAPDMWSVGALMQWAQQVGDV